MQQGRVLRVPEGVRDPVAGVRRLALAGAGLMLLAGCTAGSTSGSVAGAPPSAPAAGAVAPTAQPASAEWSACGDGFQCATLAVPLDRTGVDAGTVDLALVRLPASGPGERIGSIVLNPGGPGASGVGYARAAVSVLPQQIRARFDVVGFDPRGVAGSGVVSCLDTAETEQFLALDPTPDTAAEVATTRTEAQRFAQLCGASAGALLRHVSTIDTARDLDDLRASLGDDKLTYLGKSYGTFLGATYAALFPDRVRALVLDGVVDPTLGQAELDRIQAVGFERAFEAFLGWCVAERSGCGLGAGDATALMARYAQLVAQVDARPLPAGQGRVLGEGLLSYGTATGLYSREQGWPAVEAGLRQAVAGNGAGLLALADAYSGRQADGTYDHQIEATQAINCVDRPPYDGGAAAYDQARAALAVTAPNFGPLNVTISQPCLSWPAPVTGTVGPIRAAGAPPILLVGGTGDPATPYSWAQSLARQMESATLLTYEGDGHTVYGDATSSCIDAVVDAYLLTLTVPAEGTRCR